MYCLSNIGPMLWNKLNLNIRTKHNINNFKSKL